ncbi:M126 protein, partial [Rhinopomastus cyanomelas]|nr:M126 protein [Rhinopomastus cyanomelas]
LNKDKELSFEEFTIVLAKLTNDAHHIIHKEDRCWTGLWAPWCGQLSELEKSMDVIIDVFHHYSRREGDKDTLTKKELKLMIESQLANYLNHVKDKATIDEIMKDLDVNKDAQISFNEMMLLIVRVTIATHDHLHEAEGHQHSHQHKHPHQHHH